jgi:hypothetical protein
MSVGRPLAQTLVYCTVESSVCLSRFYMQSLLTKLCIEIFFYIIVRQKSKVSRQIDRSIFNIIAPDSLLESLQSTTNFTQ